MASGCTMVGRQTGAGSVMLWAMLCWGTLGPAIHVDVTLTGTTYLSIVADHIHPSWKRYSLMAVASFTRMMCRATQQQWFRNGLRSTTSLRCWLGLQIPQISIQSSICGMCWTNKSNPWRPHLATYRTCCQHLGARYHRHFQGSSGVHALMGLGCFGSKSGTNTTLGRWSWSVYISLYTHSCTVM